MKKFILLLSLLFLCSCATIDHTCLQSALIKAEQIQEKDNLLFVEGDWNRQLWARHVQLWILTENGEYKMLTGGLINEHYFKPTHLYSYNGYMAKVERLGWLDEISHD